jgi:pimeloyl-ACP methyl ester carboxylesterase
MVRTSSFQIRHRGLLCSQRRSLLLESLESRRLLFASAIDACPTIEADLIGPSAEVWFHENSQIENRAVAEGESSLLNLASSITGTVNGYGVSIDRHDAPGELISTDARTWLIMHGNSSAPSTTYIDELANVVHTASGGDQVLTLDWSTIAALAIGTTESNIIPVAEWASAALTSYGFSGGDLNFMGHSFGAYVAGESAERILGGVSSIVGLDPAADWPFGFSYNPNDAGQIDFAGNSLFSWAFSDAGGLYGSGTTPASADEAITVQNTGHSEVVSLFTNMLNGLGNPSVSQLFPLSRLLSQSLGPWLPNQYNDSGSPSLSGAYEAVITADATGLLAESIEYFSLATPPEITVTTPNGGEEWAAGSIQEITWSATDDHGVAGVDLYYSTSGLDGPFTPIALGQPNDGNYSWTVPENPTTNAYIRAVAFDTDGNNSQDDSDSNFTITSLDLQAPQITLLAPNGGEEWVAGSVQTITWSATDNVGVTAIDLEYSLDGGTTRSTIATGEENDGLFSWSVPNFISDNAIVSAVAYDAAGNSGQDVSDAAFSITSSSSEFKDYANADLPVSGNLRGSFQDTINQESDGEGVYQQIEEESYANNRSRLEHKWTFDVTGGGVVSFHLEGYTEISDSDDFIFAYSTDDVNYVNLPIVVGSVEQNYSTQLADAISGRVYVRVIDTNRGRNNNSSLDSIFIDDMYFLSVTGPVTPFTDLAVTSVSAPTSAARGQSINVEVNVQNTGNQDVNTDILVTLISDNATPADPNDDLSIGTATILGGLTPGASSVAVFAWDTTDVTLGNHLLTAQVNLSDDNAANDQATSVVEIQDSQPPSEFIMDNGDEGYSASGWSSKSDASAYGSDYDYARTGSGSLIAAWTFEGIGAGEYEVYATWVSHPRKHATNASFSLFDGATGGDPLFDVIVDQTTSPGADGWALLSTLTVSSGTLTVTLDDDADGIVIADAIRVVPTATSFTADFSSTASPPDAFELSKVPFARSVAAREPLSDLKPRFRRSVMSSLITKIDDFPVADLDLSIPKRSIANELAAGTPEKLIDTALAQMESMDEDPFFPGLDPNQ